MLHSLFGNGHIVFYLPIQDLLYIVQTGGQGKIHDSFHAERGFCLRLGAFLIRSCRPKYLTVFFHQHHIGMGIRYAHAGFPVSGPHSHRKVKGTAAARLLNPDIRCLQIVPDFSSLLLRQALEKLQLILRPAGNNPCGCRGLDSFHAARVRYDDALYIFYDISAGLHQKPIRPFPQRLRRQRRRIGNGNRLRTPEGGHQLLLQNPEIFPVYAAVMFHVRSHLFVPVHMRTARDI